MQRRVELTQPRRLVGDDAARKFGKRGSVTAERQRVCQESEQEDAERVHVRACVDPARMRRHLLGAHVGSVPTSRPGSAATVEVRRPTDGCGRRRSPAAWAGRRGPTRMLAGFRSRWRTPRWWACCTASTRAPVRRVGSMSASARQRIRVQRAVDQLHRDERRRGVIAGIRHRSGRCRRAGAAPAAQPPPRSAGGPRGVESTPQDLHCDRAGRLLLTRQYTTPDAPEPMILGDRVASDACSWREDGFGGTCAVQRRGIEEGSGVFQTLEEQFHLSPQDVVACTLRDEGIRRSSGRMDASAKKTSAARSETIGVTRDRLRSANLSGEGRGATTLARTPIPFSPSRWTDRVRRLFPRP